MDRLNKKNFSKDLFTVMFSNGIVLISSIAMGFVIPKVLGVYEYGLYKTFTLYLSYSALMHFGFVDGFLLKYADKDYDDLPKEKVRTFTVFFFLFQMLIGILIAFISILFLPREYKITMSLLGIDVLAVNMTAYYQYVSQATMRFSELSIRKILLAVFKIVLVIIMALLYKLGLNQYVKSVFYVAGLVVIDVGLCIWYFKTYNDISIGKHEKIEDCLSDIKSIFKEGIILTIAFQTASIIFSLDRQFVSILFDTETYGIYSFAYSIISMVTTVVGAVSFVLFPRLKRLNKASIIESFPESMESITIISSGAMLGYQPLTYIIQSYLPEYIGSIQFLQIVIPGLALSCCINIIMFTYYKALNKHVVYFKVCSIILILSLGLNYIFYVIFKSPLHISIASIITLLIWYLVCESYFIKQYNVMWKKNFIYIVLLMLLFYFETFIIKNIVISWFLFALSYVFITSLFYKKQILKLIHSSTRIFQK